jgi:hypothetical protein
MCGAFHSSTYLHPVVFKRMSSCIFIVNLKQEIASNGTIRGGESATPFGLT